MDNATLITALLATVDAYIDARIQRALADHSFEVDLDRLRELVGPIVEARITDAIEGAMQEHLADYDHDDFMTDSEVENKLENLDLEDQVTDAVRNLRFTVSVD